MSAPRPLTPPPLRRGPRFKASLYAPRNRADRRRAARAELERYGLRHAGIAPHVGEASAAFAGRIRAALGSRWSIQTDQRTLGHAAVADIRFVRAAWPWFARGRMFAPPAPIVSEGIMIVSFDSPGGSIDGLLAELVRPTLLVGFVHGKALAEVRGGFASFTFNGSGGGGVGRWSGGAPRIIWPRVGPAAVPLAAG